MHQAEQYRAEFESLYPDYLELYNSSRKGWDKVGSLKMRVLEAHSRGNHRMASEIAFKLDDFIKGMRTPQQRDAEVRLAVMSAKLTLLKQRLAAFA